MRATIATLITLPIGIVVGALALFVWAGVELTHPPGWD